MIQRGAPVFVLVWAGSALLPVVGPALTRLRAGFEPRWNRWNRVRTVLATVAVLLLAVASATD